MTQTTWIKKIARDVFEELSLDQKGSLPNFPLEKFAEILKNSLKLESLSITTDNTGIIEADQFFTGLSSKNVIIPLSFSPLKGHFYFAMGMDDVQTLIAVSTKSEDSFAIQDDSLVKGLFTYFITEAIDAVMQLQTYKDLSLKIEEEPMHELSARSIDIGIKLSERNLRAKLLLPKTFYQSLHSHFTFLPPTLENLENIPDLNIPLSISTGSIELSQKELMGLSVGDFLILPNSFYSPSEKKGSFQMLLGNKPMFQIKLQKDGIKILDFLYFYTNEENQSMDEEDDDDLYAPLGDDSFDDDDEYEDEEYLDDEEEESFEEENNDLEEETPPLEEESTEESTHTMEPKKASLADVPILISMEVARFSLSLEELKKLEPGYKLPVNVNPTLVNLVASGKKIGRGEIVEIGETIGVKLLELYK